MGRYLLKIAYDGTAYHGWQVQPNGITVQAVLCEKMAQLLKEPVNITGCSRTDAGVHANEFYCHFNTDKVLPKTAYINGLNAVLPKDIAVLDCSAVNDDFHARYSAKGKNYIYKFFDGKVPNPFLRNYALFVPQKIDVELMNKFCENFIGEHDFVGFSSSKRTVTDTVRNVYECSAERSGDIVTLSITANGFLYNMVRIVAGTALNAAYGKFNPSDTEKIILSGDRNAAGPTLPPQGLYLNKVFY